MANFIEIIKNSYGKPHPFEDPDWIASFGLETPPVRPFPRAFVNDEWGISSVTEPFQSLPQLKKMLIDDALLSLYCRPRTAPRVVLLTYVYWDGYGDFYGQKHLDYFLKEAGISVTQATLIRKNKITEKSGDFFIPFEPNQEPYFPQDLIQTMRKAHLILQFPTYYPFTQSLQKIVEKGPLWEFIGESGFLNTVDYQPGTERRCLGLHALEKGVFIPSLPPSISPPSLKKPYFFAYTKTPEGFFDYLEALIMRNQKKLTLVTFNLLHVLQALQKKPKGLRSVTIQTDEVFTTHQFSAKGTDIEILVQPKIPHEEFLSLLAHAEPFAACTGDHSFFEALALKKLPYYDPPPHKKAFYDDLLFIAQKMFPSALPFLKDPRNLTPQVEKELKALYTYICTKRRANEKILQIIHRSTFPHQLLEYEQSILETFANGNLTPEEALERIQLLVQNL